MTLNLANLSVRYRDGRLALDDVTLRVGPGQVVAVVGASGSGKSTLIKAVLGVLPEDAQVSGSIRLAGPDGEVDLRRTSGLRALRGRRIGYVAQDPYGSVDPWWSVGHHVAEAWRVHRLRPDRAELEERVAALGVSDARQRLRRRPSTWSGGMLQRADIVAATAHAPELVLADEPTSALDADHARAALAVLVSASRSLLLVSHDHDLVAEYADLTVVLDHGRVVDSHTRKRSTVSSTHAASVTSRRRTTADGDPVAVLDGVDLAYEAGPPILTKIDLAVAAGEIVGLCGPSGAGKSSVLRAVAGLLRPVAGSVRHGDRLLWTSRVSGPRPGYVMPIFQDSAASLDPRWPIWKTVGEVVAAAGGRPLASVEVRELAEELLRTVGLGDVDPGSRPRQLSGGQRQRVAIARVVAGRPSLVIADEPTAALDPDHAAEITALLRTVADAGCGMVVVSHDEWRLRSFADRVLRLEEGCLRPSR